MEFSLVITFFFAAKPPETKDKIRRKINVHLEKNIKSKSSVYMDSDSNVEFLILVQSNSWQQVVYESLKICQTMGKEWVLTGMIDDKFAVWTNQSTITGIEQIEVNVYKM